MKPLVLLPLVLALAHLTTAIHPTPRDYKTHTYYSLETAEHASLADVQHFARSMGGEAVEQIGELRGHWLIRSNPDDQMRKRSFDHAKMKLTELPVQKRTKRQFDPLLHPDNKTLHHLSSPYLPRQDPETPQDLTELHFLQDTLKFADPLLPSQWHLVNTELPEVELNLTQLWGRGVNGTGVVVAIIDDGLDIDSDDLAGNFYPEGSYDFNDHDPLPRPRLSDDQHGTRCAGEIAAIPNDVCGVGVSYGSKISGIRILSAPISDADEAAALNYEYQRNQVYSCSWGPPDDGRSMEAPEDLILKAMVNGVQKGRGGKGSIFVFAAGNGGGLDDQCNFDGYTNSIFSLTIGAVDRKGLHPYYSEMCAAMLVVAPSSGSGDHIHTTDVGKDKCTDGHGGTSAAAPLAGGVVALALQVRPELGWRDVQHILVKTAVHFNEDDPDWEKTAVEGRKFSYKYGYGRIDAGRVVELAETWELVKPQAWFDSPAVFLGEREVTEDNSEADSEEDGDEEEERKSKRQEIVVEPETETEPTQTTDPDSPIAEPEPPKQAGILISENGVESSYEITQEMLDETNLETLEHVTVRVWIDHQKRGDVEVELTSPNGIVSVLARQRRFDDADTGFNGWKFMSMKHWDENPIGIWKINVKDRVNPTQIGYFKSWSLQLWGQAKDASKAKDWSPAETSGPDEEQTGSEATPTDKVSQKPKPTDHLPDDHGSAEGEAHKPGLGDTSPTAAADVSTGPGAEEDVTNENGDIGYDGSGWYHTGIDTVKENKTWFAGGGGLFLLAIAAGGVFFLFRARRKRQMMQELSAERGEYAPVAEEVPMGLLGRRNNDGGKKDMYDDAFAENEMPEDDDFDTRDGAPLKYHDDFLEDEEGEDDSPKRSTPAYRDDREGKSPSPGATGFSGQTSSSSSWQEADPLT